MDTNYRSVNVFSLTGYLNVFTCKNYVLCIIECTFH